MDSISAVIGNMHWNSVITNLGFPIAMCIYLIVAQTRQSSRFEKRIEELERKADERTDELLDVVKQNTSAMVSLNNSLKGRPCLKNEANPLGE